MRVRWRPGDRVSCKGVGEHAGEMPLLCLRLEEASTRNRTVLATCGGYPTWLFAEPPPICFSTSGFQHVVRLCAGPKIRAMAQGLPRERAKAKQNLIREDGPHRSSQTAGRRRNMRKWRYGGRRGDVVGPGALRQFVPGTRCNLCFCTDRVMARDNRRASCCLDRGRKQMQYRVETGVRERFPDRGRCLFASGYPRKPAGFSCCRSMPEISRSAVLWCHRNFFKAPLSFFLLPEGERKC